MTNEDDRVYFAKISATPAKVDITAGCWRCPVCGMELYGTRYCPDCGQALDWGNEDG